MKILKWVTVIALITVACSSADDQITSDSSEEITDLQNATCPVMGGQVMSGQYTDWNGYRVHFCCAGCDQDFLADPERYMAVLAEDPTVEVDISQFAVPGDGADSSETECCNGAREGCSGE